MDSIDFGVHEFSRPKPDNDLAVPIIGQLYKTLRRIGARSDLLKIVGSWRDTMPDSWVLESLERWNAKPLLWRDRIAFAWRVLRQPKEPRYVPVPEIEAAMKRLEAELQIGLDAFPGGTSRDHADCGARKGDNAMKSEERAIFHSIRTKDGWAVKKEGEQPMSTHETQHISEDKAVRLAKEVRDRGGLAQVIFHKENGEIREEHTYGEDPERTPG